MSVIVQSYQTVLTKLLVKHMHINYGITTRFFFHFIHVMIAANKIYEQQYIKFCDNVTVSANGVVLNKVCICFV